MTLETVGEGSTPGPIFFDVPNRVTKANALSLVVDYTLPECEEEQLLVWRASVR